MPRFLDRVSGSFSKRIFKGDHVRHGSHEITCEVRSAQKQRVCQHRSAKLFMDGSSGKRLVSAGFSERSNALLRMSAGVLDFGTLTRWQTFCQSCLNFSQVAILMTWTWDSHASVESLSTLHLLQVPIEWRKGFRER